MSTASTARSRKRAHDDSRQNVGVINLDMIAPVVNTGSQHEALILWGTRTSPIDVEALDDKRRSRKIMRRSVPVVDLEKDTGQEAEKCSPNQYDACQGCSKGTNLYLSCVNKLDKPSTTNCGHIFCEKCIEACLKAQKKCPTCRKSLGIKGFHRVYLPTATDDD